MLIVIYPKTLKEQQYATLPLRTLASFMQSPPWNEHHEFRRPYKLINQIQESGNVLLVAYRILGFGLKYSALGIQNPPTFEIWNHYLDSAIRYSVESITIQIWC